MTQRSEAAMRALLDGLPDAIVGARRDGSIVFVNALAEELFGYQRDELIGQPVEILWPARIRDCYAPTPIVTATLGDLAGDVGAALWPAELSLVNGRSAIHVENRPRLTAATARLNEQPRARGRNGQTVAFQWS